MTDGRGWGTVGYDAWLTNKNYIALFDYASRAKATVIIIPYLTYFLGTISNVKVVQIFRNLQIYI